MVVVIPIYRDILHLAVILVLDIVKNIVALVHHENVHVFEHVEIDRPNLPVRPDDV